MKKKAYLAILTALTLGASLFTGCGSAASSAGKPASSAAASAVSETAASGTKSVKVGLIQLTEHPSLDEIRTAIVSQIEEEAPEYGLSVEVDYQNGQNDPSTINTICQQFVADQVDLIVAIATPAAQAAVAAASPDIPVIFSAVTDPVTAGLVEDLKAPGHNVTGTSDAIPVDAIFDLAKELTPNAKHFGLLYSTSEDNSASVLRDARAYLDANGCTYEEGAVAAIGDVQTAVAALVNKVDAIFVPIDNTIAMAMPAVAEIANKAGVPVYVSADTMVYDGGLAAVGINYTNLGKQTADMALKVLSGTPAGELPVETLTDKQVIVNPDTAKALKVDVQRYVK